ncbi:MAG TPA: cytidine deaminase [Casimicrobiaceae bacterium]|nr:cytidine deaminase [Casimicrobiaceae bacterium]
MSSALPDPNALHLVALARRSFEHAHAPYSRFRVGAAVMDERGRAFTGANVENASFGLSMCAERVAIFSAIAAGAHAITAVAVSAERSADVTPCGACRQVMAEFCKPDVPVWCDAGGAKVTAFSVGELLPAAFLPQALPPEGAPTRSD